VAKKRQVSSNYLREQSVTRSRSFSGQRRGSAGLSPGGSAGAEAATRRRIPTIAELLQPLGSTDGQFRQEPLRPTATQHLRRIGPLDEFLTANLFTSCEEETGKLRNYPPEAIIPNFKKNFGSPGCVLALRPTRRTQRIENTGPLPRSEWRRPNEEFRSRQALHQRRRWPLANPFFVWSPPPTCTSAPCRPGRWRQGLAIGNYPD